MTTPGRAALLALALVLAAALGFVAGERLGYERAKRPLLAAAAEPPRRLAPAPAAARAAAAEPPPSAGPERYTLVASDHDDLEAAKDRLARLRAEGHDAHIWPRPDRTGYEVRLGAFANIQDAQAFRAMLEERAGLATLIVSLP